MSFSRSWSFPAGSSNARDAPSEQVDTPKSSSSFFDLPSGATGSMGSRRRLGSSPPGFHLEVPPEDRPLSDELSLPMFESPTPQRWGANSLQSNSDPVGVEPVSPLHQERFHRPSPYKPNMHESLSNHDSSKDLNDDDTDLPNWVAESVLVGQTSLASSLDGGRAISSDNLYSLQQNNRQRSLTDYSNISAESTTMQCASGSDNVFRNDIPLAHSSSVASIPIVASATSKQDGLFTSHSEGNVNETTDEQTQPPVANSWGAALNPIGHSLADLLRLPSHFGSLLNMSEDSPSLDLDDSNLCGNIINYLDQEAESKLSSQFNFISRIDPEVDGTHAPVENNSMMSGAFGNFFSGHKTVPTADSSVTLPTHTNSSVFMGNQPKEVNTPMPPSSHSNHSQSTPSPSPAKLQRSGGRHKKKRDKNRRKRESDSRSSSSN